VLSERSSGELRALAAGTDGPAALLDRATLAPFLVGVHRRGEEVAANELAALLDEAGVPAGERDGLVAYVEAAFHLLDAYDRSLRRDHAAHGDSDHGDLPSGTVPL